MSFFEEEKLDEQVSKFDIQESILPLIFSSCTADQQQGLNRIVQLSFGNEQDKQYLLDNDIISHLKQFYHPMCHYSLLHSMSLIIRNLCNTKSTLPIENVQSLLIPLSILIFHQDEEIFLNICIGYNSLIDPSKLNKDYSADFLLHHQLRPREILPLYISKTRKDDLIFTKSIKTWESQFRIEIPDVIISEIKQYFILFDDQRLQQIENTDLLQRIIDEMGCPQIEIQRVLLETIDHLCSEIDICLLADQAIEYGVLSNLKKYKYLNHKHDTIRQLSYRLISTLIESTVDTHCMESLIENKILKPLIELLGDCQNVNEKQELLQIFVNVTKYGMNSEIKALINNDIHKTFFGALFHLLNHKDLNGDYQSAIDRLFRNFDTENIPKILDDITQILQAFVESNNICKRYGDRIAQLVTIIQLCLDCRQLDWKMTFPLLFSAA